MKRSFVFFCALMAGALSFSSCNKDLKDDLNELKRDIGEDEPITATTTFTDLKNTERKLTATFKYKWDNSYTDAMHKNSNGTYDINIRRYADRYSENEIELSFVYDPATKKILYKYFELNWDDLGLSNGEIEVYEEGEPRTGLTFNIDIKSIDVQAGTINFDVKIEGTKEFSTNNPYDVPNRNSAFATAFSFNGKLSVYDNNEMPN
ncbi:hypothetical protein [Pseudoflavitalea rhizosphaerae]|uniref:hypothetical protein n=1 Tax=Pseudoflavitalea rhizosphaerae TaxID=1884793 RepID=UPI000F8EA98B|nr:hypothetical protein [Pseudoflavitalea rhizosphaerae]